jgi:Icc-related predicted phosphoesterase
MRLICASDFHGTLPLPVEIPEGDVLCIAGDICPNFKPFRPEEPHLQANWLQDVFDPWCAKLNVKTVIAGLGNHDFYEGREHLLPKLRNCKILVDEGITLNGVKFWSTPWSLPFYDWSYNADEYRLEQIYEKIPDDTRVLLSHGPAKDYHDWVPGNRNVGSVALLNRLRQFTHKVTVCTGHTHSNHGVIWDGNIQFVGCSLLDEDYHLVRKPLVVNVGGPLDS